MSYPNTPQSTQIERDFYLGRATATILADPLLERMVKSTVAANGGTDPRSRPGTVTTINGFRKAGITMTFTGISQDTLNRIVAACYEADEF